MTRGTLGRIVIVGQEPGVTEQTSGAAFSGRAGRQLDSWLLQCGADPSSPRELVYLTSVLKCHAPDPTLFDRMAGNCAHFLYAQIESLRPQLVITLGEKAFRSLRTDPRDYEQSLCKLISSRRGLLIDTFSFDFVMMHWPHPSGMNRWLNAHDNRERLRESFGELNTFFKKED